MRLPARIACGLAGLLCCASWAWADSPLRDYLGSPAGAAESPQARADLARLAEVLEGMSATQDVRVCATGLWPLVTDLQASLGPAGLRALGAVLGPMLARPVLDTFYDAPQAPFRVHYSLTGPNAVRDGTTDTAADGRPRYVHEAASAFTRAWSLLIDSLGYVRPLSDSAIGGGLNLYDCYLVQSVYAGYTAAEFWYGKVVGTDTVRVATAYTVVHSNMGDLQSAVDPYDYLRITCAHEFFHAIHFAYDLDEKPGWQQYGFWLEGTSVWFEDYAYPDVNDWGYLPYYLDAPERSVTYSPVSSASVRPYGAGSMWAFYLVERFGGPGILRDIWQRCGLDSADNTLPATDAELAGRGSSLDLAWHEFASWCLRTGNRSGPGYFAQGSMWPKAQPVVTLFSYPQAVHFSDGTDHLTADLAPGVPVVTIGPSSTSVGALGFAAVAHVPFPSVRPDSSQRLYVQTVSPLPAHFEYLGLDTSASTPAVVQAALPPGDTTAVPAWLRFDTLFVVASVGLHYAPGDSTTDPPADVTALLTAALDSAGLKTQTVQFADPYPNPLVLPGDAAVQFVMVLPQVGSVYLDIFNVAGERVRSFKVPGSPWPPVSVTWDGRNDQGTEVASGLYLCKLTVDLEANGDREEKLFRVGVVR